MWGRYHQATLNNGYKMPIIGLGTWLCSTEDAIKGVDAALKIGYRHFDTAYLYDNEEGIGSALKNSNVKRENVFITSKVPPVGLHVGKVTHFCQLSMQRLDVEYLDLYLIHFPVGVKYTGDVASTTNIPTNEDGTVAVDASTPLETAWKEMEELVKSGRVKSIGLSNCNESQIRRIMTTAEIKPAVLQIELHAYMQQKELRRFCKEHGIVLQGYSTFANPGREDWLVINKENVNLLENDLVKTIADKCNKSPAQVLLRHSIQNEVVVLPKSIRPERIKENFEVFDFFLTPKEMEMLDKLDKGRKGRTSDWSFMGEEFINQPEYPFKEN